MTLRLPHPHLLQHDHAAVPPHDVERVPAAGDLYAYHGEQYSVTAVTPVSYYGDTRMVTLLGPSDSVEWTLEDFLADHGWWPIPPAPHVPDDDVTYD